MALAVEEDVPLDPVDVRRLGTAAVVASPDGLADAIEESRLRRADRPAFTDGERCSEGASRRCGI